MKKCSRCRKEKFLEEFIRNNKTKDGRTCMCGPCTRQIQQLRRNDKVKAKAEKIRLQTANPTDGIPWPATVDM